MFACLAINLSVVDVHKYGRLLRCSLGYQLHSAFLLLFVFPVYLMLDV